MSSSSSFLAIFSNWLDHKMKDLLPLVRSYIKNSSTILNDLHSSTLHERALLFSADAKSMYTNIDTPTGISAIRDFIATNAEWLPPDFPADLFLRILASIMENNIFTFAGPHWLQLSGTAMGTPVACTYATISFSQYENRHILPTFQPQLLYYKRDINDIFGVWLPPTQNRLATWYAFKAALNNWGKLEWIIEEHSSHTTFLDLNINIEGSSITTSTYQKTMNLYLYIPPQTSHPPCWFKGLIARELKRYFIQKNKEDFEKILAKFIGRLLERGHTLENLSPLLLKTAANIDREPFHNTQEENVSTLYIHWPFHPKGLQKKACANSTTARSKAFSPLKECK
jgi:hypothetical protein